MSVTRGRGSRVNGHLYKNDLFCNRKNGERGGGPKISRKSRLPLWMVPTSRITGTIIASIRATSEDVSYVRISEKICLFFVSMLFMSFMSLLGYLMAPNIMVASIQEQVSCNNGIKQLPN